MGSIGGKTKIKIRCLDAQVPFSFYTVQDGKNFIKYGVGSPTQSFQVTSGNYTIFRLISAVKTGLIADFPNIDITYNRVTNKISIVNATNTSHSIFFTADTLFRQLGFVEGDTVPITNSPQVSTRVVDVQPVSAIYIRMRSLMAINSEEAGVDEDGGFSNTLARIGVVENAGSILNYEPNNPYEIISYADIITVMGFELTDERGEPVLLNGLHWQFTLELSLAVDE
jgi:hypothetical protein